jgi:small subunit ribosomal protein S7
MSRRRKAQHRTAVPDPKYKSLLVTQFINNVTKRGKKHVAEGIFYDAIELIGQQSQGDGMTVFKKAVDNIKPTL